MRNPDFAVGSFAWVRLSGIRETWERCVVSALDHDPQYRVVRRDRDGQRLRVRVDRELRETP